MTEDDTELAQITALNLKKYGFAVDVAFSGKEAIDLLEGDGQYDVVVLDLGLPDIDGTEVLDELRSIYADIPVLALTCRDAEEDRIKGIKIGFDDYMTKPFSHHELAARLRVLSRSRPRQPTKIIKVGPLQINPQAQVTLVKGKAVKLSLNEFRLLHDLIQKKGRLVTIEELLESIWDRNSNSSKAKVVTTISRLRKKIGDQEKRIIKTIEGDYIIGH